MGPLFTSNTPSVNALLSLYELLAQEPYHPALMPCLYELLAQEPYHPAIMPCLYELLAQEP